MKKKCIVGGIFAVLFIWLAVALKIVDVQTIGPNGSSIGLAGLNGAVFGFFGEHEIWDKITDVLLLACIAMAGSLAILGVSQMIQRKSIAKMDKRLWAVVGLYAAMVVLYMLFEKIVINNRPVLESDGTLEASFPSTHTLLSCVFAGSFMIIAPKYMKNRKLCKILQIACVVLMIAVPFGRIFAGMHWLTDVLGGYLLSGALLAGFAVVLDKIPKEKKKSPR